MGIIYRGLGLVDEVIFYGIDWMPRRFQNSFFNWLYFQIDNLAINKADYVWNLSEEMVKVRKKQGVPLHGSGVRLVIFCFAGSIIFVIL